LRLVGTFDSSKPRAMPKSFARKFVPPKSAVRTPCCARISGKRGVVSAAG
jgi:hypothetical protein